MTDATLRVTLPAETRFVAIARVTTAGLAAELDFTIDEIEELRVGADELVALLVEWAEDNDHTEVDLEYRMADDTLELVGRVANADTGDGDHDVLDGLTRQILTAVVDEFDVGSGHGRIMKRRSIG